MIAVTKALGESIIGDGTSMGRDHLRASWAFWPVVVSQRVVAIAFLGLLGFVVLNAAAGGPAWLVAWHVTTAFLLFAGALIVGRYAYAVSTGGVAKPFLIDYQLVLLVGLVGIAYQSRTPGFGLGSTDRWRRSRYSPRSWRSVCWPVTRGGTRSASGT